MSAPRRAAAFGAALFVAAAACMHAGVVGTQSVGMVSDGAADEAAPSSACGAAPVRLAPHAVKRRVPATYDAISDTEARTKPAAPLLGAAGQTFKDPVFSSRLLRVTDSRSRPGSPNRSFRVPANAHIAAWNATSTCFYVRSTDGTIVPYTFNAASMRASRLDPSTSGEGGRTLDFSGEPQFSVSNPSVIYGVWHRGNNRTIARYDFATQRYATILDLDTVVQGLSGYVGGLATAGDDREKMLVFFGGGQQDLHTEALLFFVDDPGERKLLDSARSTIDGKPTNARLDFRLHAANIDKSGRFVLLYPTARDLAPPRRAAQVYVWDTDSDTITPVTSSDGTKNLRSGGHDAIGYGTWVNQDCCTATKFDAAQWQIRPLSDVSATRDLINPVLSPKQVYWADHSSWSNAVPDANVPFISATYRLGTDTAPWRAWDDEIIAVATDVPAGRSATVWRFAHHRSDVTSDSDPTGLYFWYEPIVNVAPNGRWAIFTSNWEKTLGLDPVDGMHREDVFLIALDAPAVHSTRNAATSGR